MIMKVQFFRLDSLRLSGGGFSAAPAARVSACLSARATSGPARPNKWPGFSFGLGRWLVGSGRAA